jgi:hypothetical protein
MKKLKKQPSVVPVYLFAATWAVGGFIVRVHKPLGFVVLAAVSIAVFLVANAIWKPRKIVVQVEDKPKKEPVQEEKPEEPPVQEDPEVVALRQERDRAISEMRRLNDNIKDPVISQQIDHIEATTGKIFAYVMERPEKKNQIRRFLNYYLPTTMKLLDAYDRMGEAGVSGKNVDGAKGKISELMATIVTAFDHQLDALYADEALDIDAEITVLKNVLTGDGLIDKDTPSGGF